MTYQIQQEVLRRWVMSTTSRGRYENFSVPHRSPLNYFDQSHCHNERLPPDWGAVSKFHPTDCTDTMQYATFMVNCFALSIKDIFVLTRHGTKCAQMDVDLTAFWTLNVKFWIFNRSNMFVQREHVPLFTKMFNSWLKKS